MKKKLLWLLILGALAIGGGLWWFQHYAATQVQHHEDPGMPEGFSAPPDPDSVE